MAESFREPLWSTGLLEKERVKEEDGSILNHVCCWLILWGRREKEEMKAILCGYLKKPKKSEQEKRLFWGGREGRNAVTVWKI